MSLLKKKTPIFLFIALAAIGLILLQAPTWLLDKYESAKELGPIWGTLFLVVIGSGAVLLVGLFGWVVWRLIANTRRKRRQRQLREKNPSELSRTEQAWELGENLDAVRDLQSDKDVPQELRKEIEPLVENIAQKQESQTLEIVAFGSISGGKSSLLNTLAGREAFPTDPKGGTTVRRSEIPWSGTDKVTLVDTPGLGEVEGQQRTKVSAEAAECADIVLLVVDGPLRESEFELLELLGQMEKRLIVCLNKLDWYDDEQRDLLVSQLTEQVAKYVSAEDVVAVRSAPVGRVRRRVTPEGSMIEETVETPPDIEQLARRMLQVVRRDGSDLLAANLLLQSRGLVDQAREKVQQALDARAWELVNRYAMGAGGAAALSPWPVVDLAAGCAVSTKMVVDLARVYRQNVDTDTAVNLLGQLGKNLVAVLGTTAAAPAVAAGVASLLKTVPGVGTIAGGALQGIVMAIVTRWIGAIFIEYFKNEMQPPEGGLAELARTQWQKLTTVDELRRLVKEIRE